MTHTEKLHLITSLLSRVQPNDLEWVLMDILTPAEIDEIADRIRILTMLESGLSQRDIASELGISVTTVSRGNRVLQYENKGIRWYLN
jgi:TrpR family transcriptional regulator, trp operon repressor